MTYLNLRLVPPRILLLPVVVTVLIGCGQTRTVAPTIKPTVMRSAPQGPVEVVFSDRLTSLTVDRNGRTWSIQCGEALHMGLLRAMKATHTTVTETQTPTGPHVSFSVEEWAFSENEYEDVVGGSIGVRFRLSIAVTRVINGEKRHRIYDGFGEVSETSRGDQDPEDIHHEAVRLAIKNVVDKVAQAQIQ